MPTALGQIHQTPQHSCGPRLLQFNEQQPNASTTEMQAPEVSQGADKLRKTRRAPANRRSRIDNNIHTTDPSQYPRGHLCPQYQDTIGRTYKVAKPITADAEAKGLQHPNGKKRSRTVRQKKQKANQTATRDGPVSGKPAANPQNQPTLTTRAPPVCDLQPHNYTQQWPVYEIQAPLICQQPSNWPQAQPSNGCYTPIPARAFIPTPEQQQLYWQNQGLIEKAFEDLDRNAVPFWCPQPVVQQKPQIQPHGGDDLMGLLPILQYNLQVRAQQNPGGTSSNPIVVHDSPAAKPVDSGYASVVAASPAPYWNMENAL
ncbi:MAG: hypothetical protein Q9163_000716 [Psora crenata]